jgi:hypothetical protein
MNGECERRNANEDGSAVCHETRSRDVESV